jgi:hypothetical protein
VWRPRGYALTDHAAAGSLTLSKGERFNAPNSAGAVDLLRRMSANTADTVSATVDAVAPGWFAAALLPPDDERDPSTVVVYSAGVSQVGGIPVSLVTATCRRGRSTA